MLLCFLIMMCSDTSKQRFSSIVHIVPRTACCRSSWKLGPIVFRDISIFTCWICFYIISQLWVYQRSPSLHTAAQVIADLDPSLHSDLTASTESGDLFPHCFGSYIDLYTRIHPTPRFLILCSVGRRDRDVLWGIGQWQWGMANEEWSVLSVQTRPL